RPVEPLAGFDVGAAVLTMILIKGLRGDFNVESDGDQDRQQRQNHSRHRLSPSGASSAREITRTSRRWLSRRGRVALALAAAWCAEHARLCGAATIARRCPHVGRKLLLRLRSQPRRVLLVNECLQALKRQNSNFL